MIFLLESLKEQLEEDNLDATGGARQEVKTKALLPAPHKYHEFPHKHLEFLRSYTRMDKLRLYKGERKGQEV